MFQKIRKLKHFLFDDDITDLNLDINTLLTLHNYPQKINIYEKVIISNKPHNNNLKNIVLNLTNDPLYNEIIHFENNPNTISIDIDIPRPQPQPQPNPTPRPQSRPQPQPNPTPRPQSRPQLQPNPTPRPQSRPQLQPNPTPRSVSRPQPQPNPTSRSVSFDLDISNHNNEIINDQFKSIYIPKCKSKPKKDRINYVIDDINTDIKFDINLYTRKYTKYK
jgi:hypothetical protein